MKAASPRIGPCIAQRGGTIRSTAFGSLTGVFFGTFPSGDPIIFLFIKSWARCSRVEKRFDLYDVVSTHSGVAFGRKGSVARNGFNVFGEAGESSFLWLIWGISCVQPDALERVVPRRQTATSYIASGSSHSTATIIVQNDVRRLALATFKPHI